MIGLDANVLVPYLTQDDAMRSALAAIRNRQNSKSPKAVCIL